jgi:hypothetical protein
MAPRIPSTLPWLLAVLIACQAEPPPPKAPEPPPATPKTADKATAALEKWKVLTGGAVRSSPVVGHDGTIYVGSEDGNVWALNPDGTTRWTFQTGGPVHSSPAIGPDGTVYVGSDDKHVYAITPPCCRPQRIVMESVGDESIMAVSTLPPFRLPAGISITVDTGLADSGCQHAATIPAGGFTAPVFCIPALGFTAKLTAIGCEGGPAHGAGARWDADAPTAAPNIQRIADTSDPAGHDCAVLGSGCSPSGAAADQRGSIDTLRGASPGPGGGVHTRLDIPVSLRVWNDFDGSCPDGDGVFDDGRDTNVTLAEFMLTLTTGEADAAFTDLNGDACSFAGNGPARTRRCAHDASLPCTRDPQCWHCSVTTTRPCRSTAECPSGETCVPGTCVDGALSGAPAAGPCCTVGQTATLVFAGVAFTGSVPLYDILVGGRMRTTVTQCDAAPALESCVPTTDACKD